MSKNDYESNTQVHSVSYLGIALAPLLAALVLSTSCFATSGKILRYFDMGSGANPTSALTLDVAGNLYGTTSAGGSHGAGSVFMLSPTSSGAWTLTVLHSSELSLATGECRTPE